MFVVCFVCCRVEVSATSWSLVQKSSSDWRVVMCNQETSWTRRPSPRWAAEPERKKDLLCIIYQLNFLVFMYVSLHRYHVIHSVRYYPRFHVTALGLGTYYPWMRGCYCKQILIPTAFVILGMWGISTPAPLHSRGISGSLAKWNEDCYVGPAGTGRVFRSSVPIGHSKSVFS
jgi:hypothetical protein